jgi:hypothetical protein
MTFEYVTPNKTTVRRLFVDDAMKKDRYEIVAGDVVLAVVDFKMARAYWIGRLSLDDILASEQKRPSKKV